MKKNFHRTKIESLLLGMLIGMMLILPTSLMLVKLICILLLTVLIFIRRKWYIYNKKIYLIYSLIFLSGLWGMFISSLKGSPTVSVVSRLPTWFLYPTMFLCLIPYINSEGALGKCKNLIVGCHCTLLLVNIYNIIGPIYGYPPFLLAEDDVYMVTESGEIGVGSKNLHQLLFTTPFIFTLGVAKEIKYFPFIAVLTIGFVAVSSRTSLIIVTMYSMLIPLLFRFVLPQQQTIKIKYATIFIAVMVIVASMYVVNTDMFEYVFQDFFAHFDSEGDYNRYNQREVLINAWLNNFWTGLGYGVKLQTGYAGMIDAFESTYHASLAYTGLIGFSLFISYLFAILYNLYLKTKRFKNVFFFACLNGLFCCVVCAATNPVLGTFDRTLSIYLSIACLNFIQPNNRSRLYEKA